MGDIVINTERLVLKPLGTQYLQTTNEFALDTENTRYMEFLPFDDSDETLEYLKMVEREATKDNPVVYGFAIMYKDRHIGMITLDYVDDIAEFGWVLNKNYWGKGFAIEAARAVLDYFYVNKGMTHFIACCDTENAPSYGVMEKLGMSRVSEYEGRRNRGSDKESKGYKYELLKLPR